MFTCQNTEGVHGQRKVWAPLLQNIDDAQAKPWLSTVSQKDKQVWRRIKMKYLQVFK